MNSSDTNPADDSFIAKYLPNEDASLEEFHYKNTEKKKVISREELIMLEQQILELESKLNSKALQDEKSMD
jgi:predicted secreted protein